MPHFFWFLLSLRSLRHVLANQEPLGGAPSSIMGNFGMNTLDMPTSLS